MNDQMRNFYERQLAYLNAGDAKGLVVHHYQANATLVTSDQVTTRRDALVALFEAYIKQKGVFSSEKRKVPGDEG
jgi:hypothetical protein